mgnify:CR=1 FL=1
MPKVKNTKDKAKRIGKGYVQSVMFNKHLFSPMQAMNWLRQHGLYVPTPEELMWNSDHFPDVTKNYYRFRQFNPTVVLPSSSQNEKSNDAKDKPRYATKNSKVSGIKFVIEY